MTPRFLTEATGTLNSGGDYLGGKRQVGSAEQVTPRQSLLNHRKVLKIIAAKLELGSSTLVQPHL